MKHPLLTICLAGSLLSGSLAWGHHGWGSYDAAKPFSVTGPVQRMDWQNPHVTLAVAHNGKNWEAVLAPPFRMTARGLDPDMIKAGTQITLEGYPSTRVENEMRAERLSLNGKTFELR